MVKSKRQSKYTLDDLTCKCQSCYDKLQKNSKSAADRERIVDKPLKIWSDEHVPRLRLEREAIC